MKRLIEKRIWIYLMVLGLVLVPVVAQAFNPATHIYIAEQVFPKWGYNINLYYGSFAPDLSMYLKEPAKWSTAYEDTHIYSINLTPYAWTLTQKAFKDGWFTHNGVCGADFYAHGEFPRYEDGYVIEKAKGLLNESGPFSEYPEIDLEFAHDVIEAAIDLLIKEEYPKLQLGSKLLEATLFRSWEDRNLLMRVFVWNWKDRKTEWETLASAELTFRYVVLQYALALNSSNLHNMYPMGELGSNLAWQIYGIEISPEEVVKLLNAAVDLCWDYYKEAIGPAIEGIICCNPPR